MKRSFSVVLFVIFAILPIVASAEMEKNDFVLEDDYYVDESNDVSTTTGAIEDGVFRELTEGEDSSDDTYDPDDEPISETLLINPNRESENNIQPSKRIVDQPVGVIVYLYFVAVVIILIFIAMAYNLFRLYKISYRNKDSHENEAKEIIIEH